METFLVYYASAAWSAVCAGIYTWTRNPLLLMAAVLSAFVALYCLWGA